MAEIQEKQVLLRYGDDQEAHGTVQVRVLARQDRIIRGTKACLLCWGGAVVGAFLPFVHFVLVPGLLLAGPLAFFWKWSHNRVIIGGSGKCPACAAEIQFMKGPDRWPQEDLCETCHRNVLIELNGTPALSPSPK